MSDRRARPDPRLARRRGRWLLAPRRRRALGPGRGGRRLGTAGAPILARPILASALGVLAAVGGAACDDDGALSVRRAGLRHPERLVFGRVPVGVGRALDFEVENVGGLPVRIDRWSADPEGRADVTVRPDALVLPAGASASVTVRFVPLAPTERVLELPLRMETDLPNDRTRTLVLEGRGVRDGLEAAPSPLRFGRVVRGRSSVRPLEVTSLLADPVDLGWSVEPGVGGGRFEVTDPEPGPAGALGRIDPGGRRVLRLRYTPAPNGPAALDRATGVLRFCPSAACELAVPLEGEAIRDPLVCAPAPIDFGVVRPDRRRAAFTACTNTGQRAVRVLEATLAGGSAPVLSVPPIHPVVLPPAGSETFEARLDVPADAELGRRSGALRLVVEDADDRAALPDHEVEVRARVGGALLRTRPSAVDFGRVAVGLSGDASLTVENAGADVLAVTGFETEAPFSLVDPPVGLQLAAGESAEIRLRFAPAEAGPALEVLRLTSDAVEDPAREVPLGGVGLDLPACEAELVPSALDFGEVAQLRSTTRGVLVRNLGDAPCLLRDPAVMADAFRLVGGDQGDVLIQPGEAWTYVVGFRPTRLGLATGALTVEVSDPTNPERTLVLRGSGATSTLILDPDEVDFGAVAPGCAAPQTLRVHNPGPGPRRITAVRLGPTGVAGFELGGLPPELAGAEGLDLPEGGTLTFEVRYVPAPGSTRALAWVEVAVEGRIVPAAVPLYGEPDLDPFVTERWVQADATSVDVLFVIDNSRSMELEQAALRASFPRFIRYAEDRGLDYRVGVVSTDTDVSGTCERTAAVPLPGTPRGACGFLSEGSATRTDRAWRLVEPGERPSPEVAFDAIADVGLDGSAEEAGLRAATYAIEPRRLTGWNTGFLARADAFFAVVFLSDENDQSPGPARLYAAALGAVKGARFRDRYALSGIIVDPEGCGASGVSGRYLDAIRRSGGTVGSICDATFDATIDRIARAAAGLRERFPLRRPAFSPSIEVRVDRVPLTATSNGKTRWTYEPERNAVVFAPDSVPREGAEVVIRYRPRCFSP